MVCHCNYCNTNLTQIILLTIQITNLHFVVKALEKICCKYFDASTGFNIVFLHYDFLLSLPYQITLITDLLFGFLRREYDLIHGPKPPVIEGKEAQIILE